MMLGYFSAGDSPFFFAEQLQAISWFPRVWDATTGFGRNLLVQLWIDYPIHLVIKIFAILGFDWWSIDKILWIFPIFLAVVSVYKLSAFFGMKPWQKIIATVVYTTNTYALLLFDGGQRGVLLAYAFVPLLVYAYMRSIDTYAKWNTHAKTRIFSCLILSLLWGILIAFDLRFAYMCVLCTGVYFVISSVYRRIPIGDAVSMIVWLFILPLIGAGLIHAFWVLPLLLTHTSVSLGEEYTSVGMLSFLSVADFSHAISFLHPNWPENLFGKVYFLQPEFLFVPIIAFSALFSASKQKNKPFSSDLHIYFLAILTLIGAFFAKGVQKPFGEFFAWSFDHIPGFVMFRDPTKFYLFIAIGYAFLIPISLLSVSEYLGGVQKKYKSKITGASVIFVLFILLWIYMIRPVFLGTLRGNFSPKPLSSDYKLFKDMLIHDQIPSRVLWLPTAEKFSFSSETHPILTSESLFKTSSISGIIQHIDSSVFQRKLYSSGVKYVVIPTDEWKKMFLTDYVYDPRLREQLILALRQHSYVKENGFTDLVVFTNQDFHFETVTPSYILEQKYWVIRGLWVSGITLCVLCLFLLKYRGRYVVIE